MGYFDDIRNIEEYVKSTSGHDGSFLIDILSKYLPEDSSVLVLGLGPGVDLLMLAENYNVTGSDCSEAFLDRKNKQDPGFDLVKLDAVSMDIEGKFDCIYSKKVLHHLSSLDLRKSFQEQARALNAGGYALHSFWCGNIEEFKLGLRIVYYSEESIRELIGPEYEVVDIKTYTELREDDSLYILLRRALNS